jgi:hypothetical protein
MSWSALSPAAHLGVARSVIGRRELHEVGRIDARRRPTLMVHVIARSDGPDQHLVHQAMERIPTTTNEGVVVCVRVVADDPASVNGCGHSTMQPSDPIGGSLLSEQVASRLGATWHLAAGAGVGPAHHRSTLG